MPMPLRADVVGHPTGRTKVVAVLFGRTPARPLLDNEGRPAEGRSSLVHIYGPTTRRVGVVADLRSERRRRVSRGRNCSQREPRRRRR